MGPCRGSVAVQVRHDVVVRRRNPGKSPSQSMNYGFRVGFPPLHGAPNQRMKLSWRGGRLKGKDSILMAAAAPRSLCAIR